MSLLLISSSVAIIVSFICSLTEAVLLSLNSIKVERDKNKGQIYAIVLDKLKKNFNRPISAILILNTVAHTGGATIAGGAFDQVYGDELIWLFSLIFSILILFGSEILPKVIGVTHSGKLAKYIAIPLDVLTRALYPIIVVTELFNKLIIRKKTSTAKYSLEDIQTIAKVAQVEIIIDKDQENIIVRASNLKNRKIEEIILPIKNVIFVREDIGIDEFFELAEKHLHTRYPVSESNSPQDIKGYLNYKEIAIERDDIKKENLKDFIRPIIFVKNTHSIIQVLKQLSMKHYHLAIVQNADGKNIGMITLEDIVEEIVGEIVDEFDTE
jgi:putative hemolysin